MLPQNTAYFGIISTKGELKRIKQWLIFIHHIIQYAPLFLVINFVIKEDSYIVGQNSVDVHLIRLCKFNIHPSIKNRSQTCMYWKSFSTLQDSVYILFQNFLFSKISKGFERSKIFLVNIIFFGLKRTEQHVSVLPAVPYYWHQPMLRTTLYILFNLICILLDHCCNIWFF